MTSYPRSPHLNKGGIVRFVSNSGAFRRLIALPYDPETLSATLAVQATGGECDRLQAMRSKGARAIDAREVLRP